MYICQIYDRHQHAGVIVLLYFRTKAEADHISVRMRRLALLLEAQLLLVTGSTIKQNLVCLVCSSHLGKDGRNHVKNLPVCTSFSTLIMSVLHISKHYCLHNMLFLCNFVSTGKRIQDAIVAVSKARTASRQLYRNKYL